MKIASLNILFITLCAFYSCNLHVDTKKVTSSTDSVSISDTVEIPVIKKEITAEEIQISKELLYDKYTLKDVYPYQDTIRCFQWDKIKERLALLETICLSPSQWAIIQNYKNRNGEAPLVKRYQRNVYGRIADTLGIERYQSVPLYLPTDTITPERYGQDGELTRFIDRQGSFVRAEPIFTKGEWMIPQKYVKNIGDTVIFNHVIVVDRHNQNIVTLERVQEKRWKIRSMNPATTGQHRPPYAQETPLGMFVLQEKKIKMVYLKDGSQKTGGYAPYASRFTDGAYIHGVPVAVPQTSQIEYSWSLGTTPRSHMCVRNATSHAKFVYNWAPVNETIIFVIE